MHCASSGNCSWVRSNASHMLIQFLLLAVIAALLVAAWNRVRQGGLSRLSAIAWTLFWAAAALVVLRPEIASSFASALGVGRGADAVVYLAVVGLYWLVFRIFVRLDRLDRDITTLTRTLSLQKGTVPFKGDSPLGDKS